MHCAFGIIQTMKINTHVTEEETLLSIEGKIDAVTSGDLQAAMMDAFEHTRHIVLELGKVTYISSAGLRVLLLGHKTAMACAGQMTLKHVTETVMDVLEMTGFSSLLTIEA